jgi:hypothetical protein
LAHALLIIASVANGTSLISAAALLLGCSTLFSTAESAPRSARPADRIVPEHIILIALDGVRPEDVFRGADPRLSADTRAAAEIVPNLMALAKRGVAIGAPGDGPALRASGPNFVSLPGYLELLSGRDPHCQENDCDDSPPRGLADAMVTGDDAVDIELAVISSWERIEHTVTKAEGPSGGALVSTGRSGGSASSRRLSENTQSLIDRARNGSAAPGHGDYRPDRETIPIALSYLEHERPRFLFVSLGDTDELAHHDDYDGYLAALSQADRFIGDVVALSETWRAKGERTAIFVTTDHGRAKNFRDHGREHPESAEVWMIAAGDGIVAQPAGPFEPERRLRDVAHTIAVLADIPFVSEKGSGQPIGEMLAYDPSR